MEHSCFFRPTRCILTEPLDAMNHAWESGAVEMFTNPACPDSGCDELTVVIPGPASDSLNLSDNAWPDARAVPAIPLDDRQ